MFHGHRQTKIAPKSCTLPSLSVSPSLARAVAVLDAAWSHHTKPVWTSTLWSSPPPRLTPDDRSSSTAAVPLVLLPTAPHLRGHRLRQISVPAFGDLLLRRTPGEAHHSQPGTREQGEQAGLAAKERLKSEETQPMTRPLQHDSPDRCFSRTWLSRAEGCGASAFRMGKWSRCIVRR